MMNKPTKRLGWLQLMFAVVLLAGFSACTKEGDVIHEPDPEDQASTAPLVMIIYDPNALGDRGYNDLIYQGVEDAARQHGLRTMQLSPISVKEGLTYLQTFMQTMAAPQDTVRRLLIVAAVSYDDFLRQNNNQLEKNPYADLLYFETETPLQGKGSTFYMPYYGAMYEAGAIAPAEALDVLLVGANPKVKTVADAVQGFTDGFNDSPIEVKPGLNKALVTAWLSDEASGGFSVADSTALRLMRNQTWENYPHLLVPVCGGAGVVFRRLCELLALYNYVGIDCPTVSSRCNFSVVKRIDKAVVHCIEQWLSPEGMPKHQTLGIAEGYTGIEIHPFSKDSKSDYDEKLGEDVLKKIHEDAIRKEAGYGK